MAIVLSTERLRFEPFNADDRDVQAGLHSDLDVQRLLGGKWSDEVIRKNRLQQIFDQQHVGF